MISLASVRNGVLGHQPEIRLIRLVAFWQLSVSHRPVYRVIRTVRAILYSTEYTLQIVTGKLLSDPIYFTGMVPIRGRSGCRADRQWVLSLYRNAVLGTWLVNFRDTRAAQPAGFMTYSRIAINVQCQFSIDIG